MKHIVIIAFCFVTNCVLAGTLSNQKWTPSSCGEKPGAVTLDSSSLDVYNRSIKAVNSWQQKMQTYMNCLVKEANDDNNVIAKTANQEQEEFRSAIKKINDAVASATKKFDKQ